jgi:hypothetical protein
VGREIGAPILAVDEVLVSAVRSCFLTVAGRQYKPTPLPLPKGELSHFFSAGSRVPNGPQDAIRSTIRNGLAFLDRYDAVDARYTNFFARAAGPSNFQLIDFGGGPEAEVQSRIGG